MKKTNLKIANRSLSMNITVQRYGGYYSPRVVAVPEVRQGCSSDLLSVKLNKNLLNIDLEGYSAKMIGKIAVPDRSYTFLEVWVNADFGVNIFDFRVSTDKSWNNSQNWWPTEPNNVPLLGTAKILDRD